MCIRDRMLDAIVTPYKTLCNGSCDGSAKTNVYGGTQPYTFNWSAGNAVTQDSTGGLCAGNYSLTITDINLCQFIKPFTVGQPSIISIMMDEIPTLCYNSCDGKAIASASGGTSPYIYSWNDIASQTGDTAIGLCSQSYTVTVKDKNMCTSTASVSITHPTEVIAQVLIHGDVKCSSNNDGYAQVSVSGGNPGFTYEWSEGSTSNNITYVGAGTYWVTVTDANGCTDDTSIVINSPAPINISLTTIHEKCAGAEDGQISAIATGGTSPFTYVWSNAQTSSTAIDLAAGGYILTITDAHNCQKDTSLSLIHISEPTRPY